MEFYAIMSDIHGNLLALKKAICLLNQYQIQGIILLGDIIDYGPDSNEVIECLRDLANSYNIVTNIWGNHEQAILEDEYMNFSSKRGVESAKVTKKNLCEESINYLQRMEHAGFSEFEIEGKICLAIHGSLEDFFWKSIEPDNIRGSYEKYDYVFSGHSHIPHHFLKFSEINNARYRNKKKTEFINPGSIGQPRDLNNKLSFALINFNTGECHIKREEYNIKLEQSAFSGDVDEFYKIRLERGV